MGVATFVLSIVLFILLTIGLSDFRRQVELTQAKVNEDSRRFAEILQHEQEIVEHQREILVYLKKSIQDDQIMFKNDQAILDNIKRSVELWNEHVRNSGP
jgi:predicted Holliday junction resolvase-like endonuclease